MCVCEEEEPYSFAACECKCVCMKHNVGQNDGISLVLKFSLACHDQSLKGLQLSDISEEECLCIQENDCI